jgi:hypothetical protein
MMGMVDAVAAPIDEAIGLLAKRAPRKLELLRAEFPESAQLLKAGMMAGPSASLLRMRAKVCREALAEAEALAADATRVAQSRLTRARKIEFGGQLVALLGTGGVLGSLSSTLSARFPAAMTYCAAAVAFLGSLASAISQHLNQGFNAQGGGVLDHYTVLVESRPVGRALDDFLRVWQGTGTADEGQAAEITETIGKANELCARVYKAARMIPGVPFAAD